MPIGLYVLLSVSIVSEFPESLVSDAKDQVLVFRLVSDSVSMFKVNPVSDSESDSKLVSDLKLRLISTGFIWKIGFLDSKY